MVVSKNIKDEYTDLNEKNADEEKDELLPMASILISKETLADTLNDLENGFEEKRKK